MRFLPLLLLLVAAPLYAQQDQGTQIGVGVRVNDLLSNLVASDLGLSGDAFFIDSATLLVPININGTVRIEPEIGYGRASASRDRDDFDFKATTSILSLGVGVMPLLRRGNDTFLYAGGRVRFYQLKRTVEVGSPFGGDDERSDSSFGIAPVAGGEYFFSDWFSLGGEAGLEYRSVNTDEDDEQEIDQSSLSTLGAVYVRFYFN